MSDRLRRPGNRVVRKRLDAQRVIDIRESTRAAERPTRMVHAKIFVMAVAVIFFTGAILLSLPVASESGEWTHPIDALFISVSAFSVTGLTTVDTQAHWSFFGELVVLVLIQLGGFGFMVGTSLVLIALGRGSSLRANMMMQDGSPTMTLQDVSRISGKIVRFILIVEAIGAVILSLHFMRYENPLVAIWWGVFHSISAFCNAGFDLQGNFVSMNNHNESPVLLATIGILIQFGALSYMVIADVARTRGWKRLQLDSKLVLITNFALITGSALLFLVVEWNSSMINVKDEWKPLNAVFQAVAARTAGFTSVEWNLAHDATEYLWVAVMMIGGAAGSTAGGIKLATLAVIVLTVASTVRGKDGPQAFGRRISTQIVYRSLAIAAIFLAVHFMLSLALVITEDVLNDESFSFVSLMFESMSALATVGLSTGVTTELSIGGKLVLIAAMWTGRLGPITVAYALQSRQKRERFRYPEASIRIG